MKGDLDAVLRVIDVDETPGRWAWLGDDEAVLRRLALRLEVERLRAERAGRQPFDDRTALRASTQAASGDSWPTLGRLEHVKHDWPVGGHPPVRTPA